MKLLAKIEPQELGNIGGEGLGPFANIEKTYLGKDVASGAYALSLVTKAFSAIIGFLTFAASIWFIIEFIIGGFYWITSGGDKNKLHEARERITNAFIGLIIIVAGWSILAVASEFLGVDLLISQPKEIIEKLLLTK